MNKLNVPILLSQILLFLAILLEVFGSLIIVLNNLFFSFPEILMHFTYLAYLVFLILVTLIYHPYKKDPYKFLANTSLFGGLLFFYIDYLSTCDFNVIVFKI